MTRSGIDTFAAVRTSTEGGRRRPTSGAVARAKILPQPRGLAGPVPALPTGAATEAAAEAAARTVAGCTCLGRRLAAQLRALVDKLTDPYRPELHYMRGPGPKWRAKHGIPEPGSVPLD
ncbi:hypothetical protein A33M_2660 [Rhodovulum sp. PH10]|uniref:hypothetical protein n=1 Tax=Rhodovulum sp. PH10 TaxID=1187851 RepID=UPI00027C2368|nr:hypothetical protein [Rhodovulum sp. PH10]EJW11879.1 hypothetical protein A33M_2660 [Rhodovulum sp. PH10]